MRRALAHAVFVTLLSTLATLVGVVSSMTATRPGRHLLARIASEELAGVIRGRLAVREISGSFLGGLVLDDVQIHDTLGGHLATIPTIEVTYRLPQLLAGQIVLTSVWLDAPDVELRAMPSGRLNLKEIFRLGEGTGTGPSPLIQFRDVRIDDARVRIESRWTPDDTVVTAAGVRAALARERAKLGRVIEETGDGFRKIVTIDALTARLRQVTASSPDGQPLTIDIDSLYTDISDPQVSFRHAVGRVQVPGDSLIFSLEHAALPRSEVLGGGVVVFREGTEFFDFTLVSSNAALADFRWVSTDFPDMAGATLFAARTEAQDRSAFVLRDMSLTGTDGGRLEGNITVVQDDRRGLGFRDVDVQTDRLDLDAIRPFLDSLPFYGTVTGRTRMDGYFDALAIGADWRFVDVTHDSLPVNTVLAEGVIHVDDTLGLVFDSISVANADLDLRSIRRLAPAVILEGRLGGSGLLRGPLRNAAVTGQLVHVDGERPPSVAHGYFRLDTRRDTLALEVDATLDPLDFEGIRRGFPGLATQGQLRGHVVMDGPITANVLQLDVAGDLGAVELEGTASLLPEALGGAPLNAVFRDLDLARLLGRDLETRLNGHAFLDGRFTADGPAGSLSAHLGPSRVREWPLDTVALDVAVVDGRIRLDTLHTEWVHGALAGSGTLGWRAPAVGTMAFGLLVDSLGVFDTLVVNAARLTRDTTDWRELDGILEARLELTGALDALGALGQMTALDVALGQGEVEVVRGALSWSGGADESLAITARLDTVQFGGYEFPRATLALQGQRDSLAWGGTVAMGRRTEVTVHGRRQVTPGLTEWRVDTVAAYLVDKTWDLLTPSVLSITDSAAAFTGVRLAARDGSGFVRVTPFGDGDEFELDALGVGLRDLYGLFQRDTTDVGGSLAANLILGGTREAPEVTGTVQVADATLTDFRAPLGRGVVRYRDRTLDASMVLWRTGLPVLTVDARLPLNMALARIPDRRLEGPLFVRMVADSVDLGVFDAFTTSVDELRGEMVADVQIQGSWEAPSLSGFVDITNARGRVEGLGVTFQDVVSRAHLVGDSILIDTLGMRGAEGGSMDVTGWVRMDGLTSPVLSLDILARGILLIDAPEFLTLAASGNVHLEGPFAHPVLTGAGTADRGVLYFADLVNKQVLDLEDPDNQELVDLSFIRQRNLGSRFQNRFLDSLRIVDLDLDVQDDFYLRSNEANILLEGDLRVNKVRREYRLAGTLRTIRGRYQLRIGNIVNRNFEVRDGTVRYFGTPDLDAQLDITAEHRINPVDRSDPITVVAAITGTMRAPRLQLTNRDGPPISQSDLVSYLMFGKPAFDLSGGQNQTSEEGALAWGLTALSSALSSEVERTLISDIGLPIDYLQIRPGATPIAGSSVTSTRISAGWSLTPRLFITLSAGFCPNDQLLNYKALGASLEWRFTRQWRSSVSLAPSEACEFSSAAGLRPVRYQIGVDLLWEREF